MNEKGLGKLPASKGQDDHNFEMAHVGESIALTNNFDTNIFYFLISKPQHFTNAYAFSYYYKVFSVALVQHE